MSYDLDLFVIGAGSGGVRAARMSAGLGARVAIAEDRYLGGTCVNVGCIPKKLFVYAAHYAEDFHDATGFGWNANNTNFNWQTLIRNKNHEISRLNAVYERLLRDAGATLINGRAKIKDAHTVTVGNKDYSTERILIATGGWPSIPDIPGKEHVVTSNEIFFLEQLPQSVTIAGGGYIAVEFACILNGLGVDITLLYRGPLFLRGFDEESRIFLAQELRKKGIKLEFNTNIERIEKNGPELIAYDTNNESRISDLILYATGRNPNTANIGLSETGVNLNEAGAIIVDEYYQTSVPSIYAIGDVTDRVNLTPVATAEGTILAKTLFGNESVVVDYNNIPTCIFSQPNLGTVGLTEHQAREMYQDIKIYKSTFTHLKHTLTGSEEKTFMKLIVDMETDRVIGIHMIGPDAGEIIQGMAIAMKVGATKAHFDATIGIHPTAAEEFVTMREPAV